MSIIKKWLYNARSFAAPQNLMPSILTVIMAIGVADFNLWLGILAILGVCFVHLGGNLLDDYFDYQDELLDYRLELRDQGESAFTDKYPYLRNGSTTVGQLKAAIAVFFGVASLFGAIILIVRSMHMGHIDWSIICIAAIVAFLCWFYSGKPFQLGFHGLGELVIGICFGPCLVCGVYEAACGGLFDPATGKFAWHILFLGIAIGMFVTNILYTHSFVERHVDDVSHKKTLAVLLRTNAAGLIAYAILLFTPFILFIVMACVGYISPWYCLVLLMLPRACWVMGSMMAFSYPDKPFFVKHRAFFNERHSWLGPMDNWEQIEPSNRYYLLRWYTMRNVNTGFCLILAAVKIALLILQ